MLQHRRRLPGPHLGLDAQLLGVHPQTLEARGLHPPRLPLLQLRQRRPPPQAQGLFHQEQRTRRIVLDQSLPTRSTSLSNTRWSSSSSPRLSR